MYGVFVLACFFSAVYSELFIIRGKDINIEDVPYQVNIYDAGKHRCGGSIISLNYILTAGHCASSKPQTYKIRVGSSKNLEGGQLINVTAVIIYGEYRDENPPWNDIALMKVSPPIIINNKTTAIVKLAEKDEKLTGKTAMGIRDGQICAEHPDKNKDVCNGDSGSPLVVDGKQVGIVSWSGPHCARPNRPGVYTEVAAYRDWIDKHVKF